jgi:multicomponent Na+:H+ antiporter subunit E
MASNATRLVKCPRQSRIIRTRLSTPAAPEPAGVPYMRKVVMFVFLGAVWMMWSGMLEVHLLAFGVLSVTLALILAIRMGCFAQDVFALHLIPHMPGYIWFLFQELVKSNIYVAKIVLSPRIRISPCLIKIDVSTMNTLGIAVLGNSITLTPSTATVNIEDKTMHVHCLTKHAGADLVQSGMRERVQRVVDASSGRKSVLNRDDTC